MTRRQLAIGLAPFCVLLLLATVPLVRNWLGSVLPVWVVVVGVLMGGLASGAWLQHWVTPAKGEGR